MFPVNDYQKYLKTKFVWYALTIETFTKYLYKICSAIQFYLFIYLSFVHVDSRSLYCVSVCILRWKYGV